MAALTIRHVRAIPTSPGQGSLQERLIIVKVETSRPGLYGLRCETFTQRQSAVEAVVDEFAKPLGEGRLIDFTRCHLSIIGRITPAKKLAARYPRPDGVLDWTKTRVPDGTGLYP